MGGMDLVAIHVGLEEIGVVRMSDDLGFDGFEV